MRSDRLIRTGLCARPERPHSTTDSKAAQAEGRAFERSSNARPSLIHSQELIAESGVCVSEPGRVERGTIADWSAPRALCVIVQDGPKIVSEFAIGMLRLDEDSYRPHQIVCSA